MLKRFSFSIVVLLLLASPAIAQSSPDLQSAVAFFQKVAPIPNLVYLRANGWEGRLDIYAQRSSPERPVSPVVVFIHGGGWVRGAKETSVMRGVLPYVAMGYSVVNVEYRLGNVSLAPAAIEDCRCALRWVVAHAKEYKFDIDRIVIAGESAGGHLALTTGMLTRANGFDRMCQEENDPKVAAIVNFFGITDLADMLDGPNKKPFPESWPYTVQWIGNQPNRVEIAKAASPLTYVRAGLPPVISIHGDADPLVPYQHSVRLNDALQKAGVAHELVTIPGAGHGNFKPDEWQRAFVTIEKFLAAHVPAAKKAPSTADKP
jgi:acetyl esterase/lipase